MKEGYIIVPINKKEMEYLTKEKKVPFGENGIYAVGRTYSKWYVAETRENMQYLENFRKSRIIEK